VPCFIVFNPGLINCCHGCGLNPQPKILDFSQMFTTTWLRQPRYLCKWGKRLQLPYNFVWSYAQLFHPVRQFPVLHFFIGRSQEFNKQLAILQSNVLKLELSPDPTQPDWTQAYFWLAVNKRPTCLWPRYFLTRPKDIFLIQREKNWKFDAFRGNFPNSNPNHKWLTHPEPQKIDPTWVNNFWPGPITYWNSNPFFVSAFKCDPLYCSPNVI